MNGPPDAGRAGGEGEDDDTVAGLLGRQPLAPFEVVRRRPDGTPVVIENAPFLVDGTPMPTRFWLVDPVLRDAVSTLEAAGGVRQAERDVNRAALEAAHARYSAERDALIDPDRTGPRPNGGVGGTRTGVKCLHAHLAWWLAGGTDPVGDWVAERLGPELARFGLSRNVVGEEDGPGAQ